MKVCHDLNRASQIPNAAKGVGYEGAGCDATVAVQNENDVAMAMRVPVSKTRCGLDPITSHQRILHWAPIRASEEALHLDGGDRLKSSFGFWNTIHVSNGS